MPSGCAARWSRYASRSALLLGGRARPRPSASRTASACRLTRSAVARSVAVAPVAARSPSGVARSAEVSSSSDRSSVARAATKPAGSSRSSAVGSRSGCAQTRVAAVDAAGVASARPTGAAASRSRRGRSSSPTSVANVCSAGPPVARRRRSVSRSAAGAGQRGRPRRRRPRRPSPRRARAASPAGPAPPSAPGCPRARTCPDCSASCIASGLSGRADAHRPPRAGSVSTLMPRA